MKVFISPDNLNNDTLLLPALYSAEQRELMRFMRECEGELTPLVDLAREMFLWANRGSVQLPRNEPLVGIQRIGKTLAIVEFTISGNEPLPEISGSDIVLVPRGDISVAYLTNALRTDMFRRQFQRIILIERHPFHPLFIEKLGHALIPSPDSRSGGELVRAALLNPSKPRARLRERVLDVPPPLSVAEAVAAAVAITDHEMLRLNRADAGRCLFIEHLTDTRIGRFDQDSSTFPVSVVKSCHPSVQLHERSAAPSTLRPIVELLQRTADSLAWLNLPDEITRQTGLPAHWARTSDLRSLLRRACVDDSDEAATRLEELYEPWLESYGPESAFASDHIQTGLLRRTRGISARHFFRLVRSRRGVEQPDGATREFVATEQLRLLLREHVPPVLGRLQQRETLGLVVQGPLGSGKSRLLALLAAVASDRASLQTLSDRSVVETLREIAGKYRTVSISAQAARDGSLRASLVKQLKALLLHEGFSDTSATPPHSQSVRDLILLFFRHCSNGRGFLVIIDEFETLLRNSTLSSVAETMAVLDELQELSAEWPIRLLIATTLPIKDVLQEAMRGQESQALNALTTVCLPEWDLSELIEYVHNSYHPFLVVRLPGPEDGPGGVLLKPWRAADCGVVSAYHRRLTDNLRKQFGILRALREHIADDVVGRIRHMFKNRIAAVRQDLTELAQASDAGVWGRQLVIEKAVVAELTKARQRTRDYYCVSGYLARMRESLDSLTKIVDQISAFYRAGSPHPEKLDVHQVLQAELDKWQRVRPDVRVIRHFDTIPAIVSVDKESFREVLDNILTNSDEHLPKNRDHTLEVVTRVEHGQVVIEISNDGSDVIPDCPTQAHVTTKPGRGGLGLTIAARNTTQAGGSYSLLPRRDTPGVTNRIELPNAEWQIGETAHE